MKTYSICQNMSIWLSETYYLRGEIFFLWEMEAALWVNTKPRQTHVDQSAWSPRASKIRYTSHELHNAVLKTNICKMKLLKVSTGWRIAKRISNYRSGSRMFEGRQDYAFKIPGDLLHVTCNYSVPQFISTIICIYLCLKSRPGGSLIYKSKY